MFVDFTAAWCVTCQYNHKTTLANPAVMADLSAKNVALVRADWTRRDPITAALGQLGRNGVPLYVLYQNGRPPVVLSEILSVDEVRSAVASLLTSRSRTRPISTWAFGGCKWHAEFCEACLPALKARRRAMGLLRRRKVTFFGCHVRRSPTSSPQTMAIELQNEHVRRSLTN